MINPPRYNNPGTARFVTFSCYHGFNLLKSESSMNILSDQLSLLRNKYGFKLFGYVFMPNHVHLILLPKEGDSLGRIIGEYKSLTARRIINSWKDKGLKIFDDLKVIRNNKEQFVLWQRRYYDHNCQTVDDVLEKINYCHSNPMKKRLVSDPGDWKWSSFRRYTGMTDAGMEIDFIEL